jgi:uncharacterized delta-60 repeat protein
MKTNPTTCATSYVQRLLESVVGVFVAAWMLGTSHASTNTYCFNSPDSTNGPTIFGQGGGGYLRSSGGSPNDPEVTDPSTNGCFAITDAVAYPRGIILFPDFDLGLAVRAFKFSCDVRIGAGSSSPADGFSICFARPNDPLLINQNGSGWTASPCGEADLPEEGTQTGLAVCFDAWGSGCGDVIGLTIRVDNTIATNISLPFPNLSPSDPNFGASLQTGTNNAGLAGLTWQPLSVEYTTNGLLNVAYKGVTLLTNFVTPFLPTAGRLILGGRAGAYNQNQHIDNLRIVTMPVTIPPIILAQPVSRSVNAGDTVGFSVTAVGSPPPGYQWRQDGVVVAGATAVALTLTNVQRAAAGGYDVVVSNQFGSVTSVVALLTVNLATVDLGFNPGAGGPVHALAVQPDGKIVVGGDFPTLAGQARDCIGRFNTDGTLDASFNPGANDSLFCLAVQADGKILVGGYFTTLGGQPCNHIDRLNNDGTLDSTFNPGASVGFGVYSLAVQVNAKVLVGGYYYFDRLNGDGTLDTTFNSAADDRVCSLAVQTDGKILVGGYFTTLGGQTRNRIGRLNGDGTLDTTFNPGANSYVYSLAVQADGKILVGGAFTMLGGQTCNRIGRLNPDGTLDTTFNPGVGGYVNSLAVQADGKVLVGGYFTTLGGQTRNYIGRLNSDGTLDTTFDLGGNATVYSLAVQADGKILVGGYFTTLGGQTRYYFGRLNNTEPATQNLSFDGSTLTWLRGSTSPEVWRTSFDASTNNGTDWLALGTGARITGGWRLTGLSVPSSATIRARGFVTGGLYNGSSWFVESTLQFVPQTPPTILTDDGNFGFRTNQFGFNVVGVAGQTVVIEGSTNLVYWLPLATNLFGPSPFYFGDLDATNFPVRFYRARLQ